MLHLTDAEQNNAFGINTTVKLTALENENNQVDCCKR